MTATESASVPALPRLLFYDVAYLLVASKPPAERSG